MARGTRIGRVFSEWFNRPPDRRFLSLTYLWISVKSRSERSRARIVEIAAIRVEASRNNAERLCTCHGGIGQAGHTDALEFWPAGGLVGALANYLCAPSPGRTMAVV